MSSSFTFEKSNNNKTILNEKKRVGRPQEQDEPRNKAVNCYLTESEYKRLNKKLDGRPRSSVLRNLLLQYIDN